MFIVEIVSFTRREANTALELRLDEFAEWNRVFERDALSVQKLKKECNTKLPKLKSRCTKGEDEIASLRSQLSSPSDLQSTRIDEAVAAAREETARGFEERVSEVAGLLTVIGGKAQADMLDLAEIDANLEFIGLLQGPKPPDLLTKIKALRLREALIYDAYNMFEDLLARVRRVLEIPEVSVAGVEVDAADDDDVEASDDDVEEGDNDVKAGDNDAQADKDEDGHEETED
ncbi:hypothetical protein AALP_AAs41740U000100 [Arabis alpina]|nr:hypothetical protein AALP_AAs41740U000100 [Arabis alpina]